MTVTIEHETRAGYWVDLTAEVDLSYTPDEPEVGYFGGWEGHCRSVSFRGHELPYFYRRANGLDELAEAKAAYLAEHQEGDNE